eukprot:NODE_771_length_4382_cov_0.329442.p3 type:complete len:126 gc:universal NODE_771_length_4382_cov_0.329442:3966-4343(+)
MMNCPICYEGCKDVYSHICEAHIGYKTSRFDIYSCPFSQSNVCQFSSPKRHQLTSHIKIHLSLKFYACNFCDKSFKQKHDCKKHMIAKHRDQKIRDPVKIEHDINQSKALDIYDPNNFGLFQSVF